MCKTQNIIFLKKKKKNILKEISGGKKHILIPLIEIFSCIPSHAMD